MIFLFPSSKPHPSSSSSLGLTREPSPGVLGERLFWDKFKQTNQPLSRTNRSIKMALSERREPMVATVIKRLLYASCNPPKGCREGSFVSWCSEDIGPDRT
jgi:hypothetical protein